MPNFIAVDSTSVYWTTNEEVKKVEKDGSMLVTLVQNGGSGITVDDTYVYWAYAGTGSLMRLEKTGGTPIALATGQAGIARVVLDQTNVYWANSNDDGAVMTMPLSGDTEPVALATGRYYPNSIDVDATHVYWLEGLSDGAVMKVSK